MCDRQRLSLTGGLEGLGQRPWKTRIAEPKQKGFARWRGDEAARRAVTNNRTRLLSGVAKEAFKLRAEIVERSFAHNLDRGGMRRTWLRGRENVHKRYLLHVAGHNLSLLMRQLIGAGTPREAVAGGYGGIFVLLTPAGAMLVALGVSQSGQTVFAAAFLIWGVRAGKSHLINGLLGLSEGIETALSAQQLFGLPCWAALGSRFVRVALPDIVAHVVLYADNGSAGVDSSPQGRRGVHGPAAAGDAATTTRAI